jgi:hydroxyacylglutathione hydrolase
MKIKKLTFNPYSENTYILFDDSKECAIVDPGCYGEEENEQLTDEINSLGLKPTLFLNTHCHLDHVFGNSYVSEKYGLLPQMHKKDLPVYNAVPNYSGNFGFQVSDLPQPEKFLEHGDTVAFGNTILEVLFTPGHSPGSLCFYHERTNNLIGGDVIFQQSIGRTDLPGGDFDTLMRSIKKEVFALPNETKIWSGHGPETTVGFEKMNNPFLT